MTNDRAAFLLSVLLVLSGSVACHPVNTMPPPPSPSDPVKHYDLEIPDALEIKAVSFDATAFSDVSGAGNVTSTQIGGRAFLKRSEEHTSELQSRLHLVCRLLLEKKKKCKTAA